MLLDIREKVRGSKPIKYTLITVISIPFALVGIGSYFSGRQAAAVGQVDGVEISQTQLDQAYNQQRQRLAQMFGGQIPDGFENEAQLRQQALEQLVTAQVMRGAVEEQGFAVGDDTLGRAITEIPAFQFDGKFDPQAYKDTVRSMGMSVAQFEQSFRQDTALNQFRAGVIDTSFVLPLEQSRLDALNNQTRTVDIVRFDLSKAMESIAVSDDDVSTYFTANAEDYKFPQRAKIQYIELNSKELADAIDVSDEEALEYYTDNKARYIRAESRAASHILLSIEDTGNDEEIQTKTASLNDIKNRIVAGESFADLAKEFSADVGSADSGGSLGVITPGAMVAEFEEAVFTLAAEGDISEPIETEFGLHLIKLDSITPESGQLFDEVKNDVINSVRAESANRDFTQIREQLTELVFDNPESLDSAAEQTGLEVKTSDWIDTDTVSDPVLSNNKLLAAAFSEDVLTNGNNSDLIEIGPRHVAAIRVLEHNEPRPKTLDDVKEDIATTLRRNRAGEQLDVAAKSAVEQLTAGKLAKELAEADELALATTDEVLKRQSSTLDRNIVADIFALAKPTTGKPVTLTAALADGDRVSVLLKSVDMPDTSDAEKPTSFADPRRGDTEFTALLNSMRSRADISLTQ